MHSQTLPPDEIHWFLPEFSKRFQIQYPDVPFDTAHFPNLTLHRVEDLGPNTKIAHLLDLDGIEDDDRIIVFDDDTVYDPRAVQTLVRAAGTSQGCGFLGHTFVNVPFQYKIRSAFGDAQRPRWFNRVRVMLCAGMVNYPRKMFPKSSKQYKELLAQHSCLNLNDDHVMAIFAQQSKTQLFLVGKHRSTDETQPGALKGLTTARCQVRLHLHGLLSWNPIEFAIALMAVLSFVRMFSIDRLLLRWFRPRTSPGAPKSPLQDISR